MTGNGTASFSDTLFVVMALQWLVCHWDHLGTTQWHVHHRLMINMLLQIINHCILVHSRAAKEAAGQARAVHDATEAHLNDLEQKDANRKKEVLLWTKSTNILFMNCCFQSRSSLMLLNVTHHSSYNCVASAPRGVSLSDQLLRELAQDAGFHLGYTGHWHFQNKHACADWPAGRAWRGESSYRS